MNKIIVVTVLIIIAASSAFARPNYTVRPGDTLRGIAARELGDGSKWQEIARLNRIPPPYRLRAGRVLLLAEEDSSPLQPEQNSEPQLSLVPDSETIVRALPDTLPPGAVSAWSDLLRPVPSSVPSLPLTMQQAIDIGMIRAPEIAAAAAGLERVREEIGVVRSGALPQISARGDARRLETFKTTSSLGVDESTYGGTLAINQTLFSFGRLSHALKAAKAEEAAALAALARTRSDVRFRIESNFLAFLLARERLAVATQALEVSEALHRSAIIKEEVGTGTLFDISRARADRAGALAVAVSAQSSVDAVREALAASIGLSPATPLLPEGSLLDSREPVPPTEGESLALSERPDVAVLRHQHDAAAARINYQRAQGLPTVDAIASGTYTRHDYATASSLFRGQDASSAFVGVGVTVPIFDGNKVRHAVRAQEAATSSAQAELMRSELEAVRDVRAIYYDLGSARETLIARRDGTQAAEEALRQAQVAFEAGRVSSLEVIQAGLVCSDARRAQAEAMHAYRLGLARLVRATGTELSVRGGASL